MFEELIEKVSTALENHNIPYIIVGGQAVLVYGRARLTNDIDFIIGSDLNGLKTIKSICSELGLINLKENDDDFIRRTMVLPAADPNSLFKIDFVFSFTEFEKSAIKRANEIFVKTKKVKFASIEDLIVFKVFAGRPIDIEDIKNLLLKNPEYDRNYVLKWLNELEPDGENSLTKRFFEIEKNV